VRSRSDRHDDRSGGTKNTHPPILARFFPKQPKFETENNARVNVDTTKAQTT